MTVNVCFRSIKVIQAQCRQQKVMISMQCQKTWHTFTRYICCLLLKNILNKTVLGERKPPRRRLTSTKSDLGLDFRFQIAPKI